MKSSRIVIPLALLACTWGCEPTPYQRAVPTSARGYSDKRLSEDTFHVEFTANFTTSADAMHEYLYRRAAELAIRHGFRYFAVIREPRPLAEYEIKYRSREDEQAGIDGKDVETPAWGMLQMTIQCFKDPENASGVRLIDARAYLRKTP